MRRSHAHAVGVLLLLVALALPAGAAAQTPRTGDRDAIPPLTELMDGSGDGAVTYQRAAPGTAGTRDRDGGDDGGTDLGVILASIGVSALLAAAGTAAVRHRRRLRAAPSLR